MRQIVLDTETTGIRVEDGHRIIEIGCIELINRKFTTHHFHQYINPEREIEAGAQAIHGLTSAFLSGKPIFKNIAQAFLEYIAGADEIIIHNAPFDTAFLDYELLLAGQGYKNLEFYCRVIDTLPMARQRHAGQRNSLDALCKRYGVDNSKREFHGALLDAHLLAQVYLAMTGGQGSFFDSLTENISISSAAAEIAATTEAKQYSITILKASDTELVAHETYLKTLQQRGKCIWPMTEKE